MPASTQLNRRIAALGTALALVMLPLSAALPSAPVLAQPSPSAGAASSAEADGSSEAGADGSDGAEAAAGSDGAEAAEADSDDQGGTGDNDAGDGGKDDGSDDLDKACKPPEDGHVPPGGDEPCVPAEKLTAELQDNKTLKVTPPADKPGSLPKSWVGEDKLFDGRIRSNLRVPAQDFTGNSGQDGGATNGTDDSGQAIPGAPAQAAVPKQFYFNGDGQVVAKGQSKPYIFENFTNDPGWVFDSDGTKIKAVDGRYYPPDDGNGGEDKNGTKSGSKTSDSDSDADNDLAASNDAKAKADSDSADSGSSDSSGKGSRADSQGNRNSNSEGTTSSTADSRTSADSSSSSDSDNKGRANDSADGGSGSKDTDSSGRADGSQGSKGSDTGSDESKDPDSDKDGAAASSGDDTDSGNRDGGTRSNETPDPATGNGSQDERSIIPGNAGDEWLPGDDEKSQRPDYSDPVPRNPDSPTPDDDTDLITGGNEPQPRSNDQPSTSFGESIVSTIVSSWPIFVLAASGMAAVGFIIYLMGRHSKRS